MIDDLSETIKGVEQTIDLWEMPRAHFADCPGINID